MTDEHLFLRRSDKMSEERETLENTVQAQVTCPGCGQQATFDMYPMVNTQANPEMKQAVRDRSAFTFVCPNCGEKTPIDYGFLYQQPEDSLIIHYVPDEQQRDQIHKMLTDPDNEKVQTIKNAGYVLRLVPTQEGLLEKLAIFDAGLDDRIMEVYKLSTLSTLRKEKPELDIEKCDFLFFADEEGKHWLQVLNDNKPYGTIGFNDKAYWSIAGDFVGILPDLNQEDPIVDRQTAMKLMKKMGGR